MNIQAVISPAIMPRLNMETGVVLVRIDDWTAVVEGVLIDAWGAMLLNRSY